MGPGRVGRSQLLCTQARKFQLAPSLSQTPALPRAKSTPGASPNSPHLFAERRHTNPETTRNNIQELSKCWPAVRCCHASNIKKRRIALRGVMLLVFCILFLEHRLNFSPKFIPKQCEWCAAVQPHAMVWLYRSANSTLLMPLMGDIETLYTSRIMMIDLMMIAPQLNYLMMR